jgi:hypothetical protein
MCVYAFIAAAASILALVFALRAYYAPRGRPDELHLPRI